MPANALYYGDNLLILRKYIRDETVDLVYIDPPFNSNADYNLLFKERDGTRAASQIKAFEDTWRWDVVADHTYRELIKRGDTITQAMYAFYRLLGTSDMFAYLVMMTPRLIELHRVLKPTGSFYLHCDSTASHYLKIVLDTIYGPTNFRNEIIWRRTRAHNDRKLTRYGTTHDSILFYTKGNQWTFNKMSVARDKNAPKSHDLYLHSDGKYYRKGDCRAPGDRGPRFVWNGHDGHWRFTEENARQLEAEGKIVYTKSGMPRVLRPVEPDQGSPLQDVWTDIDPPNPGSAEKVKYPTQKPVALLARIIESSSNPGDVVLDAFCGCGTAILAAESAHRHWIGIDITHAAIKVIRERFDKEFGPGVVPEPIGQPQSVEDAKALAKASPHAFEDWALTLVDADQPAKKRGADRGIDGRRVLGFAPDGTPVEALYSVKSGGTGPPHVRDLRGTVEREGAALGVLITLQAPTKEMKREALSAGPCIISGYSEDCPRLQIITVADLLAGNLPRYPAPVMPETAAPPPPADPAQLPLFEAHQRALPRTLVPVGKKLAPAARATTSPRKRAAGE